MIKTTYDIDFVEEGKALACFVFPANLESSISQMRDLAEALGCEMTFDINQEYSRIVITHLWENQEARDLFRAEANKLLDYEAFFDAYKQYIADAGGQMQITVSEY